MSETPDISEIIAQIEQLHLQLDTLEPETRHIVEQLLDAHDRFHRAGLAQLIRGIKAAPETAAALRAAASDPSVYALLRHHKLIRASLQEQVESALDTVRPALRQHGGDVELQSISGADVTLRFVGQCDGCSASGVTFREGVQKALREHCDWVETIHLLDSTPPTEDDSAQPLRFVSPFDATGYDAVKIHEPGPGADA